jgi:small subunit ribosomal protein S21
MIQIKLKQDESFEKAMRRFKRLIENEGLMKEIKKRKYYLKPSERKKEKRKLAAKRRRKLALRKK